MVRSKKFVQGLALAYTAAAVVLGMTAPELHGVSMRADACIVARMLYPFFHVSILHALLNCWCLLSVVFIYDVSAWTVLAAYIVAVTYPAGMLSFLYPGGQTTVGLSGICYFLLGRQSFMVKRKLYWQTSVLATILAGFLFPRSVDAWLHLYCYTSGVIAALLNKPIRRPC